MWHFLYTRVLHEVGTQRELGGEPRSCTYGGPSYQAISLQLTTRRMRAHHGATLETYAQGILHCARTHAWQEVAATELLQVSSSLASADDSCVHASGQEKSLVPLGGWHQMLLHFLFCMPQVRPCLRRSFGTVAGIEQERRQAVKRVALPILVSSSNFPPRLQSPVEPQVQPSLRQRRSQ